MKHTIVYNENGTTNKTKIVEAENPLQALTIFYGENPDADVARIEVTENESV